MEAIGEAKVEGQNRVCADCEGIEPPCCECHGEHCCHACYLIDKRNKGHQRDTFYEVFTDANISNPPEQVDWWPVKYSNRDPRASWNLPK